MDHKIYEAKILGGNTLEICFYTGEVKEIKTASLEKYGDVYSVFSLDTAVVSSVEIINNNKEVKLSVSVGESMIDLEADCELLFKVGNVIENRQIDNINIQLASKLSALREKVKMTQKDLETKSGIHQADISRIERGLGNPSLDTIYRLAEAMNHKVKIEFVSLGESGEDDFYTGPLEALLPSYKMQGDYTVRDISNLPGDFRAELIDGVIYDAEPYEQDSKEIVNAICLMMYDFSHDNNIPCKVECSCFGVCEDDSENCRSYVEPDICIAFDEKKIVNGDYIIGGPDFVCEVVSEASRDRDYNAKKSLYEKLGVREYWVLDPAEKSLTVYLKEGDSLNPGAVYNNDEIVPVNVFEDELKVNLKGIWRLCP